MRQRKVHPPNPKIGQEHPYVLMRLPGKRSYAQVDHLMVPIIQRCWALGIGTQFCCQGYEYSGLIRLNSPEAECVGYFNNAAYIMFSNSTSCGEFVSRCMTEHTQRFSHEFQRGQITLQVNGQWGIWERDFDVVRFPRSEIKGVHAALDP